MAIENLTTYTEVSGAGTITVTAPSASFASMRRDDVAYVYKDFGVGNFGNFDIDFEFHISDGDNQGVVAVCSVSNTIGTFTTQLNANDTIMVFAYNNTANLQLYLIDYNTDNSDTYINGGESTLDPLYCTFKRNDTIATLDIYSDSGRTALVDSLSITCETGTKRYLYALVSRDAGDSVADTISGYTQNFEVNFASSSSSSVSSSSSSISSSSSSTSYEPYENLTTYTEVDSDGDFTITPLSLTFDSVRQDAVSYVYYDFGLNYFGNFKIEFEVEVSASTPTVPDGVHIGLSNTIGTVNDWVVANNGIMVDTYFSGGNAITRVMDLDTFSFDPYGWASGSFVKHYFRLYRVGTTLTCEIYSNSARTTLVDTLSITTDTDAYRYMYAMASSDAGDAPATITGINEKFEVLFNSSSSSFSSSSSSSSLSSSSSSTSSSLSSSSSTSSA